MFPGELRRDLGQKLFSLGEDHLHLEGRDAYMFGLNGSQPHLDAARGVVPYADMLETLRGKVGAQIAVEHVQDIAVELGSDPRCIVVGANEPARVLAQVGAEEEPVAWCHGRGDVTQKTTP